MSLILPAEVINGGIMRPAPTNVRFDAQLISPHVYDAEIRFLWPVLTEDFYNALVGARSASASNYNPAVGSTAAAFPTSANYETLWTTHLMRFASNAVLYQALPWITVQVGANGLFVNDTEWGQNAGISGLKFMQDTLLQNIENERQALQDWLCSSAANLPDFSPSAAGYCPSGCSSATTYPRSDLGLVFY